MPRPALANSTTLQTETDIVVCLDESVRSVSDIVAIAPLGLDGALDVLGAATGARLSCMIGGLVESSP